MSEENVEIVRRVYDALNQRDWDAVDLDLEFTTQRGPNAGTNLGRQRAQGFLGLSE